MSDTENTSATNKNNITIPAVLLLVSAIVIVATFYTVDDENQVAVTETVTKTIAAPQNNAEQSPVEDTTVDTQVDGAEIAETIISTETQQITTQSNEDEDDTVTEATSAAEVKITETTEETVATSNPISTTADIPPVATEQKNDQSNNFHQQDKPVTKDDVRIQPAAYSPAQNRPYSRQQQYNARVAHAQEQARQYHEMIQQRRQVHMQEMQSRRQQYDTNMHAYREKQKEIFEAQKAVYQQAQQNQRATNQKLQNIHNRISELHQEIHQIMQDSQTGLEKSGADQQEHTSATIEKI